MEFGIPGYDDLVWNVSLVCDRIGSSTQHELQLGDYLNARAHSKIRRYRRDYAVKNIAFAPAILYVDGKIHTEFLRLLLVMVDMPTVKYFNLVGDEDDIGSERLRWSCASTFSYDRNFSNTELDKLQVYELDKLQVCLLINTPELPFLSHNCCSARSSLIPHCSDFLCSL